MCIWLNAYELSDNDVEELFQICKDASKAFEPITISQIRTNATSTEIVTLRAIHDVKNINLLAEDQRLQLHPSSITIIYGDNGSGKSGYAKILKKICRARDKKDDPILCNIYKVASAPQTAKVAYTVNGKEDEFEWSPNNIPPSVLSAISVFDSQSANIHVDTTNDVAYVPLPVHILKKLADACIKIKDKLNHEIDLLKLQTPGSLKSPKCNNQSAVGAIIKGLTHESLLAEIDKLSTLDNDEKTRLNHLRVDLGTDSSVVIRQFKYRLERINKLFDLCKRVALAVSEQQIMILTDLQNRYKQCQEASIVAANDLFKNEPLPNVGSEIWRQLWEAARQYSVADVYGTSIFPVVEEGARCVLCHQTLQIDAAERMRRFEKYISDNVKQNEINASKVYFKHLDDLLSSLPSVSEVHELINFCKSDLSNDEIAQQTRRFFITVKWREYSDRNERSFQYEVER